MSTKMNARLTNQIAKTAPSTKSGNSLLRAVKPIADRPKSSQMGKNKGEATSNTLHHKPLASEKNSNLDVKTKQTNTGFVKQKAIPIRHTLTSKLRMEKANPLLNSDLAPCAPKLPLAKLAPTPTRRSTFNPAMLRNKPKVEVKNSGTHSEKKTAIKKDEFVIQKTNAVNRSLMGNKSYASGSQTKMESAVKRSIVHPKSSQEMPLKEAAAPAFKTATIATKTSIVSKSSGPASNSLKAKPPTANKENLRLVADKRVSSQNTFSKNITSQKMSRSNTQNFSLSSTNILQKKNVNSQSQILFTKSSVKTVPKKQLKSILRKSLSTGDLQKLDAIDEDGHVLGAVENLPSVSAKTPTKTSKTVAFRSPSHNLSFSCASIAKTPSSLLRERLQNWLARQGNSSNSYRHLCCFGLPKNHILAPSNDNQSNRQESCLNDTITLESSSMDVLPQVLEAEEDMTIENSLPKGSSTPEKEDNSEQNKENVAYLANPEAITDLKKLVHSGYPRDQCELWLGYICKVQPSVKELPEYWECLASLEEARGDFTSAVDCYGKAVVKGADAQDIDGCLDDLWEKFNSLSVSAVDSKETPLKKSALDKKQIFKSTVIKFALQQKAIKKSSKEAGLAQNNVNYIVTPVRRSSRRSQSLFRTTPSVKCVDRLDDLELNIRDTMQFHCNAMLYPSD